MPSPVFEFFELICAELHSRDTCFLTNDFLSPERMQELQDEFEEPSPDGAFGRAMRSLQQHFRARGSQLPFEFNLNSRLFSVRDRDYIDFVASVSSLRGLGRRSRQFEVATCNQFASRATGELLRVGWPRTNRKRAHEFNRYLRRFGFDGRVILGKEKDGGLDILWIPPVGAMPHRFIVSIQCKNSSFDADSADKSFGVATRSLGCHLGLQAQVHVSCVLFNDYIERAKLGKKPFNYLVLGLSDLAILQSQLTVDAL
jgi:hypothetical protein